MNTSGQGDYIVQNTTLPATIIDENTITFDGGTTFLTYTYLGQGNYRGTGQSGEFIEVNGQIYAYATLDPTGPMTTGNWKIDEGDLDPSNPPCFLPGTMIQTPGGEVAVEDLSVGDLVTTAEGKASPILWVGSRRVAVSNLKRNPSLRPVRIGENAIGNDRELKVSQQHRVLMSGYRAQLLFGETELLVPAKSLLGSDGVVLMGDDEDVVYFHILLAAHEIILANGFPVESLFLGDRLGDMMNQDQLFEIGALFPELHLNGIPIVKPARRLAKAYEGVALAELLERVDDEI